MSKLIKKKGVWIFLTAVVLFFGAQVFLGVLASRIPPSADANQGFDAKGIRAIRIERNDGAKPDVLNYRQLGIRIVEPATHVAATFDSDNYALKSRVEGDVLIVTFDALDGDVTPKRRPGRGRGRVSEGGEILIPSSIKSLEFSNFDRINISAETLADLAKLDVGFAYCPDYVNFENMAVQTMTVTKRCQLSESKNGHRAGGGLRLSHVKTQSLEITSTQGNIRFEELVSAGALKLNLADGVEVNAGAALLRNAHFGPP